MLWWNTKTMIEPIKLIGIFSSQALAVEGIVQSLVLTATECDYTDYNFNTREAIKENLPDLLKWFQENSTSLPSIYQNKSKLFNEFNKLVLKTSPYSNGPGIEFFLNYDVGTLEVELNEIADLKLAIQKQKDDNSLLRQNVSLADSPRTNKIGL